MGSRTEFVALAFLTATGAGCYSTWDIAPESVVRLDGFRDGQTVRIPGADDGDPETVTFTSDTRLRFRGVDGVETEGQFRAIDVRNAVLVGVEREHGAQVSVDLSRMASIQAKNLSVGKTVGLTVGLGLGIPPTVTGIVVIAVLATSGFTGGRPLRSGLWASPIRAPLTFDRGAGAARRRSLGSRALGGDNAARARLFAHWAKETSAECASIPAFVALARDLRLSSAPRALVDRALRAAREEARHTELCAALANEYTSAPISARTPETPANTDVDLQSLLKRLALESFWDGCVAEGGAAAVARRSALEAKENATAEALQTIARDEQGHAELSNAIVAYCLSAGGRPVRDALIESLAARRAEEEARMSQGAEHEGEEGLCFDEGFARSRGLPGAYVKRAAQVEAWERSVSTLARL